MNQYSIINKQYYLPSIQQGFTDHRAVKWGSQYSQFLRFDLLSQVHPKLFHGSILDVGCGIGHLLDFLLQNQFDGMYHGIDIIGEMIETARLRHPAFTFSHLEYGQFPSDTYDFVLASGIFTTSTYEIMKTIIELMFSKCTFAIAFNSLSNWASNIEKSEFYADPLEIIAFCKEFTPKVVFNHSYLPHDFTIYMYK